MLDGVTNVKVGQVRLCHSRMLFVRTYPREALERVGAIALLSLMVWTLCTAALVAGCVAFVPGCVERPGASVARGAFK